MFSDKSNFEAFHDVEDFITVAHNDADEPFQGFREEERDLIRATGRQFWSRMLAEKWLRENDLDTLLPR